MALDNLRHTTIPPVGAGLILTTFALAIFATWWFWPSTASARYQKLTVAQRNQESTRAVEGSYASWKATVKSQGIRVRCQKILRGLPTPETATQQAKPTEK